MSLLIIKFQIPWLLTDLDKISLKLFYPSVATLCHAEKGGCGEAVPLKFFVLFCCICFIVGKKNQPFFTSGFVYAYHLGEFMHLMNISVLQIRRGNRDNLGIIFHIFQLKCIL